MRPLSPGERTKASLRKYNLRDEYPSSELPLVAGGHERSAPMWQDLLNFIYPKQQTYEAKRSSSPGLLCTNSGGHVYYDCQYEQWAACLNELSERAGQAISNGLKGSRMVGASSWQKALDIEPTSTSSLV